MIVRILGEAQFDVPDAEIPALEELDAKLSEMIEAENEAGFVEVLTSLHDKVHAVGTEVDATTIVTSGLTLPHSGSSLAEVRELLGSEELAGD